jgi:hypothetical protein
MGRAAQWAADYGQRGSAARFRLGQGVDSPLDGDEPPIDVAAQDFRSAWYVRVKVPGTSRALCQRGASDKPAVATGRLTYGAAKSQTDGVIAGLTVALVQGGQPDALPMVLTSLKKAGAGLQEVCDAALKSASAGGGTKGLVEHILKAPIEPIVNAISSGVSALWTGHVEKDKLELETIKGQLDAAKWPEF